MMEGTIGRFDIEGCTKHFPEKLPLVFVARQVIKDDLESIFWIG